LHDAVDRRHETVPVVVPIDQHGLEELQLATGETADRDW
jgi:hypothetical protein